LHRGAEVGHVELAAQALGQTGLEELDHQVLALLADVHAHLAAGKVDHHAAGAVGATAEVNVAQWQGLDVAAFRERTHRHGGRRLRIDRRIQRHQHRIALQFGTVGGGLPQTQDHARAVRRLDDLGSEQVAMLQLDRAARQFAAHAREVERNAGRRLDHETRRNSRQGFTEVDLHHLGAALNGAGDGLNTRFSLTQRGSAQQHDAEACGTNPTQHRFHPLPHFVFS
jgi:hypothetical protein